MEENYLLTLNNIGNELFQIVIMFSVGLGFCFWLVALFLTRIRIFSILVPGKEISTYIW